MFKPGTSLKLKYQAVTCTLISAELIRDLFVDTTLLKKNAYTLYLKIYFSISKGHLYQY